MKTKGDTRTCKDCIYFNAEQQCHRFPPDKDGFFSLAEPNGWCGECTVDYKGGTDTYTDKPTGWDLLEEEFRKILLVGMDRYNELMPIPEGVTVEPAAHNPEPNSSHYIDSVITGKKGKVIFDSKTDPMMFIVEDNDPCEYCSDLSGTVGTMAEILGSEGIFPPMMCHGLIYDGKACQSSMVSVDTDTDTDTDTDNEYLAGGSHFYDTGDEISVYNCFVAPVGITWNLNHRDLVYGDKYDRFIAQIPLRNRAYTNDEGLLVDRFQVIMERRQFGDDYESLVRKARDDYLKNNGPGAGLIDTTGPISSGDNYMVRGVKVSPREAYEEMKRSAFVVQDAVDCGPLLAEHLDPCLWHVEEWMDTIIATDENTGAKYKWERTCPVYTDLSIGDDHDIFVLSGHNDYYSARRSEFKTYGVVHRLYFKDAVDCGEGDE